MLMNVENLKKYAEGLVEGGGTKLAKFKENLEANPTYAMEWGMYGFTGAAQVEVGRTLERYLQVRKEQSDAGKPVSSEEHFLNSVKGEALRKVVHYSRYPRRSTSPTSNLMEQELLATWAELLNKFDHNF